LPRSALDLALAALGLPGERRDHRRHVPIEESLGVSLRMRVVLASTETENVSTGPRRSTTTGRQSPVD
jgi:hypothetical protein